ncbi:HNH endonuclease signature motif containing protein [Streptomyces celluloflavus]|uniref:HNH endonuclease signature motif containing protein n=1 Tax=Streptomyces celluloflavus TaxID=58344 RepID=UPI00369D4E70
MSHAAKYTREQLAEAAKKCTTIDEVVAFFGTRPYANLRRHLFQRFAHFGIDVSHFPPRRKYQRNQLRPSRGELRQAVSEAVSMAGTLRLLDRSENAGTRVLLRRWIADDGLDTSHFTGQAHRRGKPGTTPLKPPESILVKREGVGREKTALLRRALRQSGVPDHCAQCGTAPVWHGRPMTLEVDHINGDPQDNRPGNLRLLCPNCHAITTTWCRGGNPRKGHPAGDRPRHFGGGR